MSSMQGIFEILQRAQTGNQNALDQSGRNIYPTLGVVTDIDDPEKARRIKVADPAAPQINSHWLRRILPYSELDPPLPTIGQTVICQWVDGDSTNGWYLSLVNDTNPPFNKKDPAKDFEENIPGNSVERVGGDHSERTSGTHSVSCGVDFLLSNDKGNKVDLLENGNRTDYTPKDYLSTAGLNLTINNASGAYVTLMASGAVVIGSSTGAKIVLGGASGGVPGVPSDFYMQLNNDATWDLAGHALNITNAQTVKIQGKDVLTVGSIDSAGHVNTQRGY